VLAEQRRAFDAAAREEEARRVDDLGGNEELLHLWSLEVRLFEVVGRVKARDERALRRRVDEHGADARGRFCVDLVEHGHAAGLGALLELGRVGVGADAARVRAGARDLVGGEHPRGDAHGVLRRAAGDVLDGVVFDELVVDACVLLLG